MYNLFYIQIYIHTRPLKKGKINTSRYSLSSRHGGKKKRSYSDVYMETLNAKKEN